LRSFGVRFAVITRLGDEITCTGKVIKEFEQDRERRLRLEIEAVNQHGETKLMGQAVIAVL